MKLIWLQNAEIGLGTVTDIETAKRWLSGTFLAVRLVHNPNHYRLNGDTPEETPELQIEKICRKDLDLLQEADLVSKSQRLTCTPYGEAMARYYVKFATVKAILDLPSGAKMSEIVRSQDSCRNPHF